MTLFFEISYNQIDKRLRLFSLTVSLCIRMVKQTKLLNYKPKEKNMKKKVLLVTLLVVAIVASCFAFTACNKNKGDGDKGVKVAMITDLRTTATSPTSLSTRPLTRHARLTVVLTTLSLSIINLPVTAQKPVSLP